MTQTRQMPVRPIKRMPLLQLLLLALYAVSSLSLSACYSVGDVHVICRDGQTNAVLVDRQTGELADDKTKTCCDHFSQQAPLAFTEKRPPLLADITDEAIERLHKPVLFAAAQARGPPISFLF